MIYSPDTPPLPSGPVARHYHIDASNSRITFQKPALTLGSNDTLDLASGGSLVSRGFASLAYGVAALGNNIRMNVSGTVAADEVGIYASGNNNRVYIGTGGTIVARTGVALNGENGWIENHSLILGTSIGIDLLSYKSSYYTGQIHNYGIISGPTAIRGSLAREAVYNYDLIDGKVQLLGGDDVFVNSGANARVVGTIDLGAGRDVAIGGNKTDIILGGDNNDTIYGGQGEDVLYGNQGADTFVFHTSPGFGAVDRLPDFTSGEDQISLSSAIFSAFRPGSMPVVVRGLEYLPTAGIIHHTDGHVYYDPDGTAGRAAPQVFAYINPSVHLKTGDVIVY
ncbi:calcium-binding protein [Microvirga sp. Mcv34]|uniref:calcium-binding protein n=1 Tax=Microvirga sp. Mcv34 TaxID=2926016 RepID=UPI0021C5A470|nr:calcium-binding protein [Microvirga sp. Mcv34]